VKRSIVAILGLLTILAGCDRAPSSETAPTEDPQLELVEKGRPVLIAAGLDVVPVIGATGEPWSGSPVGELGNHNASLDLTRRNTFFKQGSIVVDRAAYGGIYMVKVASGIADRCGDAAPLPKALDALLGALSLPPLLPAEKARLVSAWQSRGEEAELKIGGRARARAVGGCLKTLVLVAE
jgi:hypothetical protein